MRKVRAHQVLAKAPVRGEEVSATRAGTARPYLTRNGIGHERRQQVGDRFGVATAPEDAVDATGGDTAKEVLQVHVDDHSLAHVNRRVAQS